MLTFAAWLYTPLDRSDTISELGASEGMWMWIYGGNFHYVKILRWLPKLEVLQMYPRTSECLSPMRSPCISEKEVAKATKPANHLWSLRLETKRGFSLILYTSSFRVLFRLSWFRFSQLIFLGCFWSSLIVIGLSWIITRCNLIICAVNNIVATGRVC